LYFLTTWDWGKLKVVIGALAVLVYILLNFVDKSPLVIKSIADSNPKHAQVILLTVLFFFLIRYKFLCDCRDESFQSDLKSIAVITQSLNWLLTVESLNF